MCVNAVLILRYLQRVARAERCVLHLPDPLDVEGPQLVLDCLPIRVPFLYRGIRIFDPSALRVSPRSLTWSTERVAAFLTMNWTGLRSLGRVLLVSTSQQSAFASLVAEEAALVLLRQWQRALEQTTLSTMGFVSVVVRI